MNWYLIVSLIGPVIAFLSFKIFGIINKKLAKNIFLVLFGVVLILFYGLRSSGGISVDYGNYWGIYNSYSFLSWSETFSLFNPVSKGQFVFSLINKFVGEVTHYNIVSFMLVLGALIVISVFLYFKQNTPHVVFCIFILLTIGSFWTSFNTIRQFLAGAVFSFSLKYAKQKKLFPFLAIVLVAAGIHWSSIFMIPFYFLIRIEWNFTEPWYRLFLKIMLFILVGFSISFWLVRVGVFNILSDQYLADNASTILNLIRPTILLIIPLWIILSGKTRFENNKLNISLNTALFYYIISISSINAAVFQRYAYFFVLPTVVFVVDTIYETYSAERWVYISILVTIALVYLVLTTNQVPYMFYWDDPVLNGVRVF